MTLGFLVLDEGARFLADPMTDLIIAGIGDVARDNGYSLLIQAARPDPDDADRLFSPLLEERVDGAFLFLSGAPSVRRRTIRRVDELGFSFVVFEQAPAGVPVVSVTAENRAGARQLPSTCSPRAPADRVHLDPDALADGRGAAARLPRGAERRRGRRRPSSRSTDGVWDPANGCADGGAAARAARSADGDHVRQRPARPRRDAGGPDPRPARPRRRRDRRASTTSSSRSSPTRR